MPKKNSEPMWCVVMFDLSVGTKKQRSEANRFRNHLFDLGFPPCGKAPLTSRSHEAIACVKRGNTLLDS